MTNTRNPRRGLTATLGSTGGIGAGSQDLRGAARAQLVGESNPQSLGFAGWAVRLPANKLGPIKARDQSAQGKGMRAQLRQAGDRRVATAAEAAIKAAFGTDAGVAFGVIERADQIQDSGIAGPAFDANRALANGGEHERRVEQGCNARLEV